MRRGAGGSVARAAAVGALGYLAACAVAGAGVGRAFGVFARARFHYPYSKADVSPGHRAALAVLEVVEWPALFALTLAAALLLWRWLRPRSWPRMRAVGRRGAVVAYLVFLGAALLAVLPATAAEGRPLGVVAAALAAAIATGFALQQWGAARASGPFGSRLAAQLPPVVGHLVATAAASASLGFRGESSLMATLVLFAAVCLFGAELACAALVAAVCRAAPTPRTAPAVVSGPRRGAASP